MERYYVGGDRSDRGSQLYNNNGSNNNKTEQREITGLTRITKKRLKELCKKDKLYQTPALNDVLYLHYQGIDCIECLEDYTGLKCLWLECNAISEIQGLDNQKQLKCLFLQSNLIKRIENLENCPELDTLNLASNHIRKIENCGYNVLPVLSTLNLSSNYLKDFDGLKDLENCKTLSVLDLSNNRIDDILVVKIFAKMPQLRVLVLQGNPVVSKLPQYRKTLILECKELTYLDSRPVFPKDRACAEAWKSDGYEGERKENERWNRMERKKIRDSVNATIRMRNKHKPPDQQDALFNSSDSDEDSMEVKRHRQAEVDAGINMELGIWEEVVNEDSKSETASSDLNVSSSTSVLSTTDSNANISADSKSLELRSNLDKDETKILNDSSVTRSQVLEITKDGNMGNILNVCVTDSSIEKTEIIEGDIKETSLGQKRVFIEEIPERVVANESNIDEIASGVIERLLDNEIIPVVVQKTESMRAPIQNLSDSDDAGKDEYNATVDAISKITMNDLSTPSPKKRIKLQIEVDDCLEMMETEEEQQPAIEECLEMELGDEQQQQDYDTSETNADETRLTIEENGLLEAKTAEQLKYEQECEEVNQKVVEDFEELSTHMDNFFVEMQKDKESVENTQIISFSAQVCDVKRSIEHNANLEEQSKKVDVLSKEPTPAKIFASVVEQVEQVEVMPTLLAGEREPEEGSSSSTDVPPEASGVDKIDISSGNAVKVEAVDNDVPGDHADTPTLVTNNVCAETADKQGVDTTAADMTPNFGRQQEKSLSSFEREERELRQLLQKLEDENEQLYKINDAYRQALEKDIREEIKYRDIESSENTNKICAEIIQDLLDELSLLKQGTVEQPVKPKNYEFGEIESDEEYSYSDPPKSAEPPVRSIREVLSSFNELLKEIARKNRAEQESAERENREAVHSKYASTEAQKAASLENLLKSPNLRDFNGDTSELLDQQIAAEKKRENARVRKLVDRVYAQKDKYNDTLEVVDGKLVVVKKDTGEIEDLPESNLNYSDTDDSDYYESANSDNEGGTESTRLWDSKVRREESGAGSFKLPYRPTERIPAMLLIQKANALKEKEEAEREAEENEQFYSLEPSKPTGFHDIDEEFIDKMDFEKATLEKPSEDVVVECTRSYTDLRQIIKQDKTELNLTEDESNILHRIVERVEQNKDKQTTGPLTCEENELLHKMVQRTKEKEKEKQETRRLEEEARASTAKPTLSKQAMKIIELQSGEAGESSEANIENVMNINQLDAEFPIPRIFRDMLDETDMSKITQNFHDAEPKPELTVLYSKQVNESVNKLPEEQEYGLFKNPLELSRGGIALTHQCDEDEFHELDTSYEDVLPATDEPDVNVSDVVDVCEEIEPEPEDVVVYQEIDEEALNHKVEFMKATPELHEKCESLRDVAVSVLKFDGSNYEEYGIDQETARGVVAYEKMLNFGSVEIDEEFQDAPMGEEEMMKSVTEALQKNELKEVKEEHVADETKTSVECAKTEMEAEDKIKQFEATEEYKQINTKDVEITNVSTDEQFSQLEAENSHENAVAADEATNVNADICDLAELTKENMRKLENLQNEITNYLNKFEQHIQGQVEKKQLPLQTEFPVINDEYKDIPQSANKINEQIGDGHTVSEAERVAAVSEPSETTTITTSQEQQSNTTNQTVELEHKPTAKDVAKSRSLANLLKSPIIKQFNDDTNESLDAQIQAAQCNDFELIECSLEVIGDDEEVLKEISVNAEITYDT